MTRMSEMFVYICNTQQLQKVLKPIQCISTSVHTAVNVGVLIYLCAWKPMYLGTRIVVYLCTAVDVLLYIEQQYIAVQYVSIFILQFAVENMV
mmetsp:Transcript_3280/g.5110  ORF Transcript_3280/g.5110 Transcript_3280/m.5110 type:complete len:93 (-) Transcript_3280:529-807(-)